MSGHVKCSVVKEQFRSELFLNATVTGPGMVLVGSGMDARRDARISLVYLVVFTVTMQSLGLRTTRGRFPMRVRRRALARDTSTPDSVK